MTLMSCKRAEKLMPLYAAGDLPEGWRRRAVAAHVAACAACAALAEEFRASREWMLAADAVPEFGDEFYEGLRAGVLDEINRDTRPAAPQRFVPFFAAPFAGRRLAYAASIALAACALALALYTFRDAEEVPSYQAFVETPSLGRIDHAAHEPSPTPRDEPTQERGRQQQRQSPAHDPASDGIRPAQHRPKTAGGGIKRPPTLDRIPPLRDAAPSRELAASNNSARQGVTSPVPRAETASVSRIEIQTADPNIRIIWLAPSSVEETEPDGVDPNR